VITWVASLSIALQDTFNPQTIPGSHVIHRWLTDQLYISDIRLTTVSIKACGQIPYPKLPALQISCPSLITSTGERKSISATHRGMISEDSYLAHFRLLVPILSGTSSKSLSGTLNRSVNSRAYCQEYRYFNPIKSTS
jgi:hypothetical protein